MKSAAIRGWLLAGLAAVFVAWSASATRPDITREDLAALEHEFDQRIESYSPNDPFELLGQTRGVYLEGYGAVFTTEINLVASAVLTPFRPRFTKEQIAQLRLKKQQRLEVIKQMMRAMMVDVATTLDSVPPDQRIAVGMTLFRFGWEDSRGIPAQLLMESRRQSLLDFESGKLDPVALDGAIRVQEF